MASQGSGARVKGRNFERKTAKGLSEWWGFRFNSSPASGALHWSGDNNVAGDLVVPPSAGFPFVIECKKHEEWTIENLFLNNKDVKNWWAQVVSDALEVGKTPMLVYTRNRAKTFVTMAYNESLVKEIEEREFPCMVSNVEFKDEFDETHCYKTFTTLIEAITSFIPVSDKNKDCFKYHFKNYDWRDQLVRETHKIEDAQQVEVMDSIDQMMKGIDK